MLYIHENFQAMCGRFGFFELSYFIDQLRQLSIPFEETAGFSYRQRWNITPDQHVVAILGDHGPCRLTLARWGLIPHWSKAMPRIRPINARAETLAVKPFFRHMLNRRHCIIPASGFYEWKATGGGTKEPWYIHRNDGRPAGMAGLWDEWQQPGSSSSDLLSCTIITSESNSEMKRIHNRMPVILEEEEWQQWLDASNPSALQLLDSTEEKVLGMFPVSTRVNNPQNDDARCIEHLSGLF